MGCSNCGGGFAVARTISYLSGNIKNAKISQEPCDYTVEMLTDFNDKLTWFKSKGLYIKYNIEAKIINKALGNVKSSLNFNNKCLYKDKLDKISDLVNLIISVQSNA